MIFKKRIGTIFIGLLISIVGFAQKDTVQQVNSKKDTTQQKRKIIKSSGDSQTEGTRKRTYSKIIDDSTRKVYGPKTTRWITDQDLFYNKSNYQPLDTSIHNFHRWTYVQRMNNTVQDLGNMGTALNYIYPTVSTAIGATAGFKAYEPYYESQAPRFYDSKSPYTRMYLVWAGNGRAMSHIEFTRNINPRWNFGFNYRPILVDRQIQRVFAERQTISHYYDFFTTYKSKNSRYFLSSSYRRIRHRIKETGGVLLGKDTSYSAFFELNAVPYFVNDNENIAESEELRNHFSFYHQYQIVKQFQIYQSFESLKRYNYFRISRSNLATNYFESTIIDSVKTTTDEMAFKTLESEVGIKGTAGFLFYDFYFKARSVENSIPNLQGYDPRSFSTLLENYIGSRIALRIDSLAELRGSAEILFDGNYKLEGQLTTPWLDASLLSVLAKPGYLQRAYRGSHNYWLNNMENTFSNQLKGFLKVRWGNLFISPGLTYTLLSNYIFISQFNGAQLPVQSQGNQQIFSPELNVTLRFFKRFFLRPQVIYTQLWKNDDNAIRIPEWFVNAQLTYENHILNKALQLQIGVDLHYKSSYKALGYAPDIQSYYIQDQRVIEGYPIVDLFLNAKIKGGRLFLKYHNAFQTGKPTGYMLAYGYPGVGNVIDFGFEIPLFD